MDFSTRYLGLDLHNPVVASASPLCESIPNLRALEDQGIAAVVLPSLFEEQLTLEANALDSDLSRGTESFGEALSYLPDLSGYNLGPQGYLELIHKAKKAISVPVIASLNGTSRAGWIRFAREVQQAGADALELNLYSIVTDPGRTAAQVESSYGDLVREVKKSLFIPVAVKISSFLTAPANFARQMDTAGADGLVLFNRFYQPDFDIAECEVVPRLALSQSHELLLRLHWVAILSGQVRADLAVTGGVHTAEDVIKCMMAGSRVAMMTSALLQDGIAHVARVLEDLARWLDEHEYESLGQMYGSMSRRSSPNPAAFDRGNYMKVLSSYVLRENARKS
ncbi:MAG TPA: dihydroorotate dehydrogenase-like protein [Methylomirabilota bacterium]|nr:dihydroorotate dehydrogenase-like protein [Methylomirabilota bacterium]